MQGKGNRCKVPSFTAGLELIDIFIPPEPFQHRRGVEKQEPWEEQAGPSFFPGFVIDLIALSLLQGKEQCDITGEIALGLSVGHNFLDIFHAEISG